MRKNKLYFFAFMEGAFVISIELLGGKMLAPVFGSSLYIWTSVIGVTLFSLTLGYFLGGILSTKKNLSEKLFFLFAISAITACAMPIIAESILIHFLEMNLFLSCILMSIAILTAPLICLGAISPLLIQLQKPDLNAAGKIAGKFYAVSTLGGIFNTFLLGFFIIPSFGIRMPLFFSCVLLLLCLLLIREIKFKVRISFLVVFTATLMVAFFLSEKGKENGSFKDIYESEGIMGQLKVVDYLNENGVLNRALLSNNSAQSIITKTNVTAISQYNYVHFISALASLKPENANVLLLGMAGGSLVYELQKQGFIVDVVDIDTRMFYIAEHYFYFQKNKTTLFTDDARHFIKTSKKKYDMIIIDISSSEVQPSYLYTTECFSEVKKILKPVGFFFINFQGVLEGNSKLATSTWSIYKTLQSAGFYSYYSSFSKNKADDVQFISAADAINFRQIDSSRINLCCSQNQHVINFIKTKFLDSVMNNNNVKPLILIDDKPMLEKLKFEAVMDARNNIRKEINKREKFSVRK